MQTVYLKPLLHREQECIGIFFENEGALNKAVRKIRAVLWSRTHKCWYVPLSRQHYNSIFFAFNDIAAIDHSALYQFLLNRKTETEILPDVLAGKEIMPVEKPQPALFQGSKKDSNNKSIHAINKHVIPAMRQKLQLKAYSPSTIRTYLNEMTQLLQEIGDIPADELGTEHLEKYFVYCFETLNLTENTLHSRINGLKFYYEQVLKRERFFWEIPRPKKQLILPKVLSEVELGKLFRSIENSKHKAIVFTAYSAGLRVSEVVNLKLRDVDSDRMTLFIEKAKGKKDRVVNLSPLLLDILRNYLQKCKPRPLTYLFEGEVPGVAYSVRSAQQIFQDAKAKAGIQKEIGFHGLRHSFATHLLEKGVDIKYIKDILGHFDIKTTERYTHVSRNMLVNIISPLDDLMTKGIL